MSTLARYLILQVPGWVLTAAVLFALWEWAGLRFAIAAGLFSLWVAKDLLLYPLLRSAYESDGRTGAEQLVGEHGVARGELAPQGFVLVRGELWRAEARRGSAAIPAGKAVRVVAARRLTLVVEAAEERS